MCSPFRAVAFAVVNDARPNCGGAQLKWGFGVWRKCCVPLEQFLYFSIIAVKSVLMFSGTVTSDDDDDENKSKLDTTSCTASP